MKTAAFALISRFRAPLIYTAICGAVLLAMSPRAWHHLATLNEGEWQAVQTFIRQNRLAEEPICFLPSWTTGHAVDQNKFRGIDTMGSPGDAWSGRDEPLDGFWVVSQFDAFDPGSVSQERYPHREHRALGAVDIYLFRREPFTLPDSAVHHVEESACVLHFPGGAKQHLLWNRLGFSLPPGSRAHSSMGYVGCRAEQGRFGGRVQLGIWFHPPPAGHSLSLTRADVPLEQWIAVSGGIRDEVAVRRTSTVKLQIALDGRTLATLDFPPQRGWKTYAVATKSGASSGRLSFKTWAQNNNSRHFLFDAALSSTRPSETVDSRPSISSSRRRPRGPRRSRPSPRPR